MISFFHKKNIVDNIAWLGLDMHNHILPGIDDGAEDLTAAIYFIKTLNNLGLDHFICTPHIYEGLYPNTPQTISTALQLVKNSEEISSIKVNITAAAEHMVDDAFKITPNLMPLANGYILVEVPYSTEVRNLEQIIFDLQIGGLKVILAHPERYLFYYNQVDKFARLKERKVFFQLNLLSIAGYYGKEIKSFATHILQKGWYDFAGTDLHHAKHLEQIKNMVTSGALYKAIGHYPFKNKELILPQQL